MRSQKIDFRSNTVFHSTMDKTKSKSDSVLRAQALTAGLVLYPELQK